MPERMGTPALPGPEAGREAILADAPEVAEWVLYAEEGLQRGDLATALVLARDLHWCLRSPLRWAPPGA